MDGETAGQLENQLPSSRGSEGQEGFSEVALVGEYWTDSAYSVCGTGAGESSTTAGLRYLWFGVCSLVVLSHAGAHLLWYLLNALPSPHSSMPGHCTATFYQTRSFVCKSETAGNGKGKKSPIDAPRVGPKLDSNTGAPQPSCSCHFPIPAPQQLSATCTPRTCSP